MDQKRIKRLLATEYKDFSEEVIVESPFAETTREGKGIREVTLALTRSTLIAASDVLGRSEEFTCPRRIHPSDECFELVSVYPLEFVNLSIFRRRRRKTLKARLINGRVAYYEIGGIYKRKKLWKIWCKQVEILAYQKEAGSSLSETTAGSSSSSTTIYFLSSDAEAKNSLEQPRTCRPWADYLGGGDGPPLWQRKDIYLGPSYNELGNGLYAPVPVPFAGTSSNDLRIQYELRPVSLSPAPFKSNDSWPVKKSISMNQQLKNPVSCDVLFMQQHLNNRQTSTSDTSYSLFNDNFHGRCEDGENSLIKLGNSRHFIRKTQESASRHILPRKISRFGLGIHENCSSGLHLHPHEGDPDHLVKIRPAYKLMDPYKLIESGVLIWENSKRVTKHTRISTNYSEDFPMKHSPFYSANSSDNCMEYFSKKKSQKCSEMSSMIYAKNCQNGSRNHLRRYGLSTCPHFLFGLGPWSVNSGDKFSIQGFNRRSCSLVSLRRQPIDEQLRLPVSKKQLATSISMSSLQPETCASPTSTRGRIVIFWTTDYWYRPREATAVYKELRSHLNQLRNFHWENSQRNMKKNLKQNLPCKSKEKHEKMTKITMKESLFPWQNGQRMCSKSSCIFNKIFSIDFRRKRKHIDRSEEERTIQQLRRLLKLNFRLSIWDIDSSTLAQQLTLIDRDLFLRIPPAEIDIIIFQKSSRNAPNVGAWIAFSHRISSLTSSEILSMQKVDMRARMLARFINSANKCFSMGNFNSAKSILAGLQNPPIYRLRSTWNYVKIHHSTRYETFAKLCRIFQNCRSTIFQNNWQQVAGPAIPFVGHLLARILGLDRKYDKIIQQTPTKWMQKDFDCGCTYLYEAFEEERKQCRLNSTQRLQQRNQRNSQNYKQNAKNRGKGDHKKINLRSMPHTVTNMATIVKNRRGNGESDKNQSTLMKRMISSTFGRVFSINDEKGSLSGNKCTPSVFWAAMSLILARRAVDQWQMRLLMSRIIREHEEKRKSIDWRRKRGQEAAHWLTDCQKLAREFDFPAHSMAWEFLLKARYKEDKENFFASLKLEPPLD